MGILEGATIGVNRTQQNHNHHHCGDMDVIAEGYRVSGAREGIGRFLGTLTIRCLVYLLHLYNLLSISSSYCNS